MRDRSRRVFQVVVVLLVTGVVVLAAPERESYRNMATRECPILDTPYRTRSGLNLTFTFPSDTGTTGWGDAMSVADVDLWIRLFSWENTLGSEVEAQFQWDNRILEGFASSGGGDSAYTLSMASLFLQWSQRYVNGYGMQMHASPGVYSGLDETDGDLFFCPAGLTLIKAVTPDFALFLGANVYPDFDATVDPVAGLLYAYKDHVVFQLAYPESRFELSPTRSIRFLMGARLSLWPEYNLGEDDPRGRLQMDEGRAFAGIELGCTERTQISLQAGYAFDRTVSFEAAGGDVELEDAPSVMIGISSRL